MTSSGLGSYTFMPAPALGSIDLLSASLLLRIRNPAMSPVNVMMPRGIPIESPRILSRLRPLFPPLGGLVGGGAVSVDDPVGEEVGELLIESGGSADKLLELGI